MRKAERVGRRRRVRRRRASLRRVGLAVVLTALVGGSVAVLATGGQSADAGTVEVTSATPDSLSLKWDHTDTAKAYTVQVATDPSMSDVVTKRFDATTGTVDGLEQGTRYWIRVDPVGDGEAQAPDTISARTESVGVPSWQGDPKATDTTVELAWTDVVGATSYVVQVDTKEEFDDPRSVVADSSSTTIEDLDTATTYWFRVAVADDEGQPESEWVDPATSVETVDNAVHAGTFNISGVHNDKGGSRAAKWRQRRPGVVAQIHDAKLDVVGLQETSTNGGYRSNLVAGGTQLEDVVAGLREAGGDWKTTSTAKSVSNDTRIIYNGDTLELVDQGGRRFNAQVSENQRYLAWAILKTKSTGREFLFVTAHLTPRSQSVRGRQWQELISFTQSTAGNRPVIVGGDFNSSKFHQPAGSMLPAMERAGFGDVLGQRYRNPSNANVRAEKTVNANIGSFNDYKRKPGGYGPSGIGNSVDYMFASNDLVVREFRLVGLNDAGLIEGTIPSDHFLLTSVVEIP